MPEAATLRRSWAGPVWVVKSQIHAGGRGKGKFKEAAAGDAKGGVRLAKSIDEVKQFAKEMLGNTLVTIQTGPAGKQVNRLYIEDGSDIERNSTSPCWWTAHTSRVAFVVLHGRWHDIEEPWPMTRRRRSSPSRSIPATGVMPHHGRTVADALGLKGDLAKQAEKLVPILYKAFTEKDMALLEINPLIVTKDNRIVCLDAKVGFDSNALYRQPEVHGTARPHRRGRQGNRGLQI